jgi:hypothetical protein
MRVYTRRTGKPKRVSHQPPQTHSLVQRIADSIGLGNSGNLNVTSAGSFAHVVKSDSRDSFEQPSLLSRTACSEEDASLKHQRVGSTPIPHVIPYEDEERTSDDKQVGSWVGVGFDAGGLIIDDASPIKSKCGCVNNEDKKGLQQRCLQPVCVAPIREVAVQVSERVSLVCLFALGATDRRFKFKIGDCEEHSTVSTGRRADTLVDPPGSLLFRPDANHVLLGPYS